MKKVVKAKEGMNSPDGHALLERVEHDHMPRQVAIELLCRSKRMTNRERKMYMQALEVHHVSTRRPKTERMTEVLANRLRIRPWATLCKILKRCNNRRSEVQTQYLIAKRRVDKLGVKTEEVKQSEVLEILNLNKLIAFLELRAKRLDLVWEGVTNEIERRQKGWVTV